MKIGSLPIPQPAELQQLYDSARTRGPGQAGAMNPAEGIGGLQVADAAGKPEFNSLLDRAVSAVNDKTPIAFDRFGRLISWPTRRRSAPK